MKVAVLWSRLAGYLCACLRELASRPGVELFVAYEAAGGEAPFLLDLAWAPNRYEYAGVPDPRLLWQRLKAFAPEIVLASWSVRAYQRACCALAGRAVRVGCVDNQWRGTLKQRLGGILAPLHLRRYYDALFVAGERQAVWARRMGFAEACIWKGALSGDLRHFSSHPADAARERFLYVGRLAPEKGIGTLVSAYETYRRNSRAPWPLLAAGAGPLASILDKPGISLQGFVQPKDLARLFAEAGCFVLPSTFEPWGVVLHEAAAAGLPIICSSECGAAVHLVQDGYNGLIVQPGNALELAAAMAKVAAFGSDRRTSMGRASTEMAQQFTPERWASCVLEHGADAARARRRRRWFSGWGGGFSESRKRRATDARS